MPDHGAHWTALLGRDADLEQHLVEGIHNSRSIGSNTCIDVINRSEAAETVTCLRHGDGPVVEDFLVVSDSRSGTQNLFSGYPVLVDGILHSVLLEKVEPWEFGIEGWLHVRATEDEIPIAFFDTEFFNGGVTLEPESSLEVVLAGLAYTIQPLAQNSFEIGSGPLWEMQRKERREQGCSIAEAEMPVKVVLNGMSLFLPRSGDESDDVEFGGVVEAISQFEYAGHTIYRLEIVVMRAGTENFRIPVYVSDAILDGWIPCLGEDVTGVLWLQGRVVRRLP